MTRDSAAGALSVLVTHRLPEMRAMLRGLLGQRPGLTLAGEAATGAGALDLFLRAKPDAALVGVCLADWNAFELALSFKQARPGCAVFLLSTAPDPCIEEVGRLMGAVSVCQPHNVEERLTSLLRRRRMSKIKPPPPPPGKE